MFFSGGRRRRDDDRQGLGQDHQARPIVHALQRLRRHGAADALRPVSGRGAAEAQGSGARGKKRGNYFFGSFFRGVFPEHLTCLEAGELIIGRFFVLFFRSMKTLNLNHVATYHRSGGIIAINWSFFRGILDFSEHLHGELIIGLFSVLFCDHGTTRFRSGVFNYYWYTFCLCVFRTFYMVRSEGINDWILFRVVFPNIKHRI